MEGRDHGGALETAGGIAKALPLLAKPGLDSFWVVSGDVFVPGFAFDAGDAARFAVEHDRWPTSGWCRTRRTTRTATSASMPRAGSPSRPSRAGPGPASACSAPRCSRACAADRPLKLRPLLDAALAQQRLGAERWDGRWIDVGNAQRLDRARAAARA